MYKITNCHNWHAYYQKQDRRIQLKNANGVIECTAFLFRFWAQDTEGSPSSNLCPETGHPTWDFSWLSLVSPGNFLDSYNRFFPHTPQFVHHRIFCMTVKNVFVTSKEEYETDSTSYSEVTSSTFQ